MLGGLALAWPALANNSPFLFSDTTGYIRAADGLVYGLTHHVTEWSNVITASTPITPPRSSFAKNVILGRSIYYGLFAYLGVLCGSFLVPALLQALLAGAAIVGSVRHVADPRRAPRRFAQLAIAALSLAAFTSLPWFVSFLMPDLFAGLALLAATVMLSGWERERRSWRFFWSALLMLAALVHLTHVLLLAGIGAGALLARTLSRNGPNPTAIGLLFAAAAMGIVGEAAFAAAVHHELRRPTVRPPFLAMRLIADGPGARFLHDQCPAAALSFCRYRDRPPATSDVLLWSADPRLGLFTAADAADQRRMAAEQARFVGAVARTYPGATLATLVRDVADQATRAGLAEFRQPVLADPEFAQRLPPSVRARIAASPGERGRVPTAPYRLIVWPLMLLSAALLMLAAWQRRTRTRLAVATLLGGVMLNAVLCGALSVPADRYQDRMIWLLPLAALLLAGGRLNRAVPGRTG